MDVNLTEGAIVRMNSNDNGSFEPVLQVIDDVKLMPTSLPYSYIKRYWISVSDGSFSQRGAFCTWKNELVDSGKLQKGSIVKFTNFFSNLVAAGRKVFVVHSLDILVEKCDLIGDPVPVPNNARMHGRADAAEDDGEVVDPEDPSGLHV